MNLTVGWPAGARYQGSVNTALSAAFDLARLHAFLDNRFIDMWNWPVDVTQEKRIPQDLESRRHRWRAQLLHMQSVFAREEELQNLDGYTPAQKLNLQVTHLWVRMVAWNFAARHDFIDIGNVEDILTPQYGLKCVRDLFKFLTPDLYANQSRKLDVMGLVCGSLARWPP